MLERVATFAFQVALITGGAWALSKFIDAARQVFP